MMFTFSLSLLAVSVFPLCPASLAFLFIPRNKKMVGAAEAT
jgi:hypothetical protein